ncbi:hypothetical protein D3C78_1351700 [compost metagenome]
MHQRVAQVHRRNRHDPGGQTGFPATCCCQCADQGPGGPAGHLSVVPGQPRHRADRGRPAPAQARPGDHAPGRLPENRVRRVRCRWLRAHPHLRQHHGGDRIPAGDACGVSGAQSRGNHRPAGALFEGYRARRAGRFHRPWHHCRHHHRQRPGGDPLQYRPGGAGGTARAPAASGRHTGISPGGAAGRQHAA